ncbi:hypothetical protein QBC40DRAFT_275461 [Triangularia verruculosa]|uniref:Secreted protein n=1 Tax=Triangularia verruculosa TaxID=2587418 RepID=A0AAN7AZP1_9PEZI|nr:hypothetical protein QBC40DRAFT_275461 [Triangularia verruculosa]
MHWAFALLLTIGCWLSSSWATLHMTEKRGSQSSTLQLIRQHELISTRHCSDHEQKFVAPKRSWRIFPRVCSSSPGRPVQDISSIVNGLNRFRVCSGNQLISRS